jgi:ubiquinone/menaquinone biosynthesis C-methylase UbiE
MKNLEHDNSTEMWTTYYSSTRGLSLFEKVVHAARKTYFGGAFARTVLKLGGKAASYLETGVGTGETLERLQHMTGARCVGVEKTPAAHKLGVEQAKHCEIILGDALQLPFPDKTFEVSYSLGLFEHFSIEEQLTFMSEQARVTTKKVLIEVPFKSPHMMSIMWFNRTIRGLKGVWADDELFSRTHFKKKFPGLPFRYHVSATSLFMTCWFILEPRDIERFISSRKSSAMAQ